MNQPNLKKLLDKLDKTAYRLELETFKRDTLINELHEARVPVRTIANAGRISHQTVINISTRYKETHQ